MFDSKQVLYIFKKAGWSSPKKLKKSINNRENFFNWFGMFVLTIKSFLAFFCGMKQGLQQHDGYVSGFHDTLKQLKNLLQISLLLQQQLQHFIIAYTIFKLTRKVQRQQNCFDEVLKIKKGPTIQFTQFTDNKVKLFSLTDKENLIC